MDFEPYSNDGKDDPYPKYRELRDDAPVHWAPDSEAWCISRHEDVVRVLMHPDDFTSRRTFDRMQGGRRTAPGLALLAFAAHWVWALRVPPWRLNRQRMLILEDGAAHRDMRNLVNRGFTPRQVQRWEKRIGELVDECVAKIGRSDAFDLVAELAVPVPVTVIAEMLGIDSARRGDFKRWSDALIENGTGSGTDEAFNHAAIRTLAEMKRYLGPIVKQRRAEPRDDLVSLLVASQTGAAALSDHEIFMFFMLLLLAGNETTTNLIGNAVDALLAHPAELARVAADPALIPGLIEETLRWDSPVQAIRRTATRDVALRGRKIAQGDTVLVLLGSANRDERRWSDPDRFDPTRDTRGHVAFGFGAHFCLGASLARLEARSALGALVPRLPGLARVRSEREFLDSYVIRGRSRLELRAAT